MIKPKRKQEDIDLIEKTAQQIEESLQVPPPQVKQPVNWRQTVSTGCLLLDLAISGLKTRYGGLPGGCMVEIYGPNSVGKSTILGEIWGNVLRQGGATEFLEPESKLDSSYLATFGININQEDIRRPSTVTDMVDFVIGPLETKNNVTRRNFSKAWTPNPSQINFLGVDSLAAFSSQMELIQGDKMGMRRAKDFSEAFRLMADHIAKYNILMVCSNQVRMGELGEEPTGGLAIGYYCTIRIGLARGKDLVKEVALDGQEKPDKIVYGQEVYFYILKNHLDNPRRRGKLRMLFNYGIDDIGTSLEWLKDHGGIPEIGGKKYASVSHAIKWVEEQGLEAELRDIVVDRWNQLESLRPERKPKVRF